MSYFFEESIKNTLSNIRELERQTLHQARVSLRDLPGGANKKFNPQAGQTITTNKSARKDYINEDKARIKIRDFEYIPRFLSNSFIPGGEDRYIDAFFSYQHEIESKDIHQSHRSNMQQSNRSNMQQSYGRQIEDIRNVSMYKGMITAGYKQITSKEQLFSCIHQLIFIHFILFMNRIKHGDMHMKNIKWIKYNLDGVDYFNIRAFDFGHAVFDCHGRHGGQRYDDLHYLFKRTSQKLFLAGAWEGRRRLRDLARGADKMEKHYPLHSLILKHNVPNLHRHSERDVIYRLQREGELLEKSLRSIQNKSPNSHDDCSNVLHFFIRTAERIVFFINYPAAMNY